MKTVNQASINFSEKELNKPIGIMDSGVGGLTVVNEIIKTLPNENIIYIGDTARVPYGTRGKDTITAFALELLNFLLKQNVKIIVIACNTISATCLNELKKTSGIEILDVIKPSTKAIVAATINKKVGIIGTLATIRSGVYEKQIKKLDLSINVKTKATPLFVPIIEEGLGESEIAKNAAKYYLSEFTNIDILHLACTHYPFFRNTIQKSVGDKIKIIDSARPTAQALKAILKQKRLLNSSKNTPTIQLNFTDLPESTQRIIDKFVGKKLNAKINQINLTNL